MEPAQHAIIKIQNEHATSGLTLDITLQNNTSAEKVCENIKINSKRNLRWLTPQEAHEREAVIVGGGPSAADHIEDIKSRWIAGAYLIAINGASTWLQGFGLRPDMQFIVDAKKETAELVDVNAKSHLFASQCDPETVDKVKEPMLCHAATAKVEEHIPPERREKGGYCIIGGNVSAGNSSLCAAYALGFRKMHLFGFDCSNRGEKSHAYDQIMNADIPNCIVEHQGKSYICSIAMKATEEAFRGLSAELKDLGVTLEVYGDGLLQDRWRTARNAKATEEAETAKYQKMWQVDEYRKYSPGEMLLDEILWQLAMPIGAEVIDFGCGPGRLTQKLKGLGYRTRGIDFAANCLDQGVDVPLTIACLWDLPEGLETEFGICCDVMEHIPPERVNDVLRGIAMSVSCATFFNISTVADGFGRVIGEQLHLTIQDRDWWKARLQRYFGGVECVGATDTDAQFVCSQ